jgi:tetratricopeptide (TPR) repeat protein
MQRADYGEADRLFSKLSVAEPGVAEVYSNLGLAKYYEQHADAARKSFTKAILLKPSLFVPNFYLAKINCEEGKYTEALPLIRKAVSSQPQEPAARALLAEVLAETGSRAEAIVQYRELRKQQPEDSAIPYQLARNYLEESRRLALQLRNSQPAFATLLKAESDASLPEWHAAALEEWQKALADLHSIPGIRLGFAEFLLRANQVSEAESVLQEELRLDPFSYRAEFLLGEAAKMKGDAESAITHFNRAVNIRPEFFTPLPELSSFPDNSQPTYAALHAYAEDADFGRAFLMTQLAGKLGSSEDAIQWRKTAETKRNAVQLALKSNGCDRPAPSNALERWRLGLKCLREKRLDEGLQLLTAVAKTNLSDSEVKTSMGRALFETGRYEELAMLLGRSPARDPERIYLLVSSYRTLATTEMENLAKTDPQSTDLQKLVAESLSDRKMYKEAAEQYRAAIKTQPDDPALYFGLGEAYFDQMQFEEAEKAYAHAIELRPADAPAHVMRASALVELGRPEEAITAATRALQLNPQLLQAHVSLGRALALMGRDQEAAHELEQAASTDTDGMLHYGLFKLYKKLGRSDDAKRALQVWEELRHRPSSSSQQNTAPALPQDSQREE